jgi:hypothetical protein
MQTQRKGSLFVYTHPSEWRPVRPVFTAAFIPDDEDGLLRSYPSRTVDTAEELTDLLYTAHITPSRVAGVRTALETAGADMIEDVKVSDETLKALALI